MPYLIRHYESIAISCVENISFLKRSWTAIPRGWTAIPICINYVNIDSTIFQQFVLVNRNRLWKLGCSTLMKNIRIDVQGSYLNARYYLNKKNNLFYYYWFNIIYCTVLVYFRGPWTKYLNVMAVLEMLSLQIANMNSLT